MAHRVESGSCYGHRSEGTEPSRLLELVEHDGCHLGVAKNIRKNYCNWVVATQIFLEFSPRKLGKMNPI